MRTVNLEEHFASPEFLAGPGRNMLSGGATAAVLAALCGRGCHGVGADLVASSDRKAATLPMDAGHHSDDHPRVAAFASEWVAAFSPERWPPSRRNPWPDSTGIHTLHGFVSSADWQVRSCHGRSGRAEWQPRSASRQFTDPIGTPQAMSPSDANHHRTHSEECQPPRTGPSLRRALFPGPNRRPPDS